MILHTATLEDCLLLAELNRQLIEDEGHRNRMAPPQLAERMGHWLQGEYGAIVFEEASQVLGYALYREQDDGIYLRQFFVVRHRRREGIGRRAIQMLRAETWPPNKRLTVEVLTKNRGAVEFWRSMGFEDYALTLEVLPGH